MRNFSVTFISNLKGDPAFRSRRLAQISLCVQLLQIGAEHLFLLDWIPVSSSSDLASAIIIINRLWNVFPRFLKTAFLAVSTLWSDMSPSAYPITIIIFLSER